MTNPLWKRSLTWLVSVLAAAILFPATRAWPCGGGDFEIGEMITFDPAILNDGTPKGLFFDPSSAGYGGPCDACAVDEMKADWIAFLDSAVKPDDWMNVLLKSSLSDLDAIIFAVQGKKQRLPATFARSSLLKVAPEHKEKLLAALYFVGFARRIETWSAAATGDWSDPAKPPAPKPDPQPLLANGSKALARAKFPFLQQRYAHALLRLRFYLHDWKGVREFFDANEATLSAPSTNLKWRSQYYLAGATKRLGDRAMANLLFARIADASPAFAGTAVQDFEPMQESDWNATLQLAKSVREKTLLWRLVGLKLDGLVAMQKIAALDPRSDLLPLLAIREINKAEATDKDLSAVQTVSASLADNTNTTRAWVFDLVAGHAAALRGDLSSARSRLERATKARPNDGAVAKQARASLALALALAWKGPTAKLDDELAQSVATLSDESSRSSNVRSRVRGALAKACAANGMHAHSVLYGSDQQGPSAWGQPSFIESVIAKLTSPTSSLERFMVATTPYKRPALQQELALAHLLKGDFATSVAVFKKGASSSRLGTDPFVIHIRDCHDCDHERYGPKSKWTHANFAERLLTLEKDAQAAGDKGAQAAFDLGNALYNITHYGNARSVLAESHNTTRDTSAAEAWYKRAYEKSQSRDLRAKASFMAAKCELGRLLNADSNGDPERLPVPAVWFPIVKTFADTKYHREILRECGHYRRWAKAS